jgi:hypothetical protein
VAGGGGAGEWGWKVKPPSEVAFDWCKLKGVELCGYNDLGIWWQDINESTHLMDWEMARHELGISPSLPRLGCKSTAPCALRSLRGKCKATSECQDQVRG